MLARALALSAAEHASTAATASIASTVPSTPMSVLESAAWERVETTKRALKESSRRVKALERELELTRPQQNRSSSPIRINQHKRRRGTKLTEDERRAVLHCYEVCLEEKSRGKSVATADPFLRTAVYFGISQNTVRDTVSGKNLQDRRGRHNRFSSVRLMASDLRQKAAELNLAGSAVTLKRLHKFVRDTWPSTYKIPGRETIRKMMCEMGFKYKDSGKTKNFVETPEIRQLRRRYLQQRYSDRFKNALFVWLDESYCNHQHVDKKVDYLSYLT